MMPEDKEILTIAVRTQKNLAYIYRKSKEGEKEKVEEFTQLLNSMLGMVISLREDYFDDRKPVSWEAVEDVAKEVSEGRDDKINLDDLKAIIGKPLNQESPELKQNSTSFSLLITKLRNAFAHRGFSLTSDGSGRIKGVTVWNRRKGRKNLPVNRTWEADISEKQLKDLAYLIVAYVKKTLA